LAKRKAKAAKTTLPPLAEKSSKLLKINENLTQRKSEAARVAAAEMEKKKIHDPSLATDLEKKVVSRKRIASASEGAKHAIAKEKGPDDDEPTEKRVRIDPIAKTDENVDILSTPQIQPYTFYPPKGKMLNTVEELLATSVDAAELEARDARDKRVVEMIQKQIAMASSSSKKRVAGLVDVVDETEELCYIDDEAPLATKDREDAVLKLLDGQKESAVGPSESLGLKPQNPIDLDAPEIERPPGNASRSPTPVSDDIDEMTVKAVGESATLLATETNVLQLEDAGVSF
jgi:hypothetical protein